MTKLLAGAFVVGTLALTVAGCGDTRSNRDLNGVATWPMGGPASGPWQPTQSYSYSTPPTYSYAPYDYGSSETTTTTTVRPGYR